MFKRDNGVIDLQKCGGCGILFNGLIDHAESVFKTPRGNFCSKDCLNFQGSEREKTVIEANRKYYFHYHDKTGSFHLDSRHKEPCLVCLKHQL